MTDERGVDPDELAPDANEPGDELPDVLKPFVSTEEEIVPDEVDGEDQV